MLYQILHYRVAFVLKLHVWRRERKMAASVQMQGAFPFLKADQTFHVPLKGQREGERWECMHRVCLRRHGLTASKT